MLPISDYDLVLLFRIIISHLLADFVIQKTSWVADRGQKNFASIWLYVHGAIAGILAYVFAGMWYAFWFPVVICLSHILFDGLKSRKGDNAKTFFIDQFGHLLVILVCWSLLVHVEMVEIRKIVTSIALHKPLWILVTCYVTVIWPVGIGIGKITEPWRNQIPDESSPGLERAGLWIGRLERILIVTFVLLNRFEAIGFLIAAKSIFRFSEIRSSNDRKIAEYILIGTMLSFVLAILFGLLARWLVKIH